jgi:4-amino-4-deoxy-L-arabinose transferase-like glycosyltransferase
MNKKTWLVLVPILFIAIFLRFYGITERGIFERDEGIYLEQAKTQRVALDWVAKYLCGISQPPLSEVLLEKGGTVPSSTKPGFFSLVILCSLFIGMHDYTPMVVSGILGVLTVFVVFLIGKKLRNESAGFIAATILAVSNYHIASSRSVMPGVTAVFFICLGFLFYLYSLRSPKPDNRRLFISGLSIGYGFTCHYNLILVPLIFLFFEFFNKGFPLAIKLKRLILLSLSICLFLIIFETIYTIIKAFLCLKGFNIILEKTTRGGFYTYFEQILYEISWGYGGHIGTSSPFYYIDLLIRNDGYLSFFLLGIGLIFFIIKRRTVFLSGSLLFLLFFIPILFWSLIASFQFDRNFLVASPMMALIASLGITILIKEKRWLILLVAFSIIINGIWYSIPTLNARSGYREAIAYMKAHKGVKHFAIIAPTSRYYVGTKNVHSLNKPINEIRELYHQGFNYLLLDQDKHLFIGSPSYETAFAKMINLATPVFKTPHTTTVFLYDSFDSKARKAILSEPMVLNVYDMKDILGE